MSKISTKNKQNLTYASDLRPSLKMSLTSKNKPEHHEGRMSVLPLKRERQSVAIENQFIESRPSSALKPNINLLNTTLSSNNNSLMNSCKRSIRKQTIINNLVNKLDEQEEIRSIIQTKLRRNSYGINKQVLYTSEFQPYSSSTSSYQTVQNSLQLRQLPDRTSAQNQDNDPTVLHLKLRQCQQQLEYFKSVIGDMSKKMKKMQSQTGVCLTKREKTGFKGDEQESMGDYKTNKWSKCKGCRCVQQKQQMKKLVNVSTQTSHSKDEQTDGYESDFFDNIQKTLKVLNMNKNL